MFFHAKRASRFFSPSVVEKQEVDLYVGGHPEKRNFGNVMLGSFEVYIKGFDIFSPTSNYVIPQEIINVLYQDVSYRVN